MNYNNNDTQKLSLYSYTAFVHNPRHMTTLTTHIPGYPRIGANRELKWALEKYWKNTITADELLETASQLRQRHWQQQHEAKLSFVATNDFSLYDQFLDTACTFGIIPERFQHDGGKLDLDLYFTLARGNQQHPALALTKWLNTNYHILVPEVSDNVPFRLDAQRILDEAQQALDLNYNPKPVIIGPVTLLSIARPATPDDEQTPLKRLGEILPLYAQLLKQLADLGVEWLQLDEPILSTDISVAQSDALATAYQYFAEQAPEIKILLASYFGKLSNNLNRCLTLPVAGLHFDAVNSPEDCLTAARYLTDDRILSIGIIDGRNIWLNDLTKSSDYIQKIRETIPDHRLWLSSSSSLQYVPHSLNKENNIPAEILPWLSFAEEKLGELTLLANAFSKNKDSSAFEKNQAILKSRQQTTGTIIPSVRKRVKNELPTLNLKRPPFAQRQLAQKESLNLPLIPTTTIGSFPQTKDIRQQRAAFRNGKISHAQYETFLQQKTRDCIHKQEQLGLDVLVHGEFERNDMVEYFASGLEGFCVTDYGWVQSYGSRCTKPPIIWGDVHRPRPITLAWSKFAQSCTDKPVKGMLTGTTTILQWSFLRNDLPRTLVSQQIALALRDEILDLEKHGINIIQLDEAALREGLPLREDERQAYLDESRDSFLISTSGVSDSTQIHTHMCYSQFDAIFETIIELDADVISIETTRNRMALLDTFSKHGYPNQIGPGIWDIHSPRIPSTEEMVELLKKALHYIPAERLWANPDCGLKTRAWKETLASLENLTKATKLVRESLLAAK